MKRTVTAALLVFAPTAGAVVWAAQDPEYRVRRIAPDLSLVSGPGPNVVVLTRDDGRLTVDSAPASRVEELRRAIDGIRHMPIDFLINTHSHAENIDGNDGLAGRETVIVAHEECDKRARAAGGRGATLRYRSRLTVELSGETITCHHKGPGHTDGDTIVHFAEANVLVVGGLVANGAHPAFVREDGADFRGWLRALIEIERDFRGSGVTVVPGDGEVGGLELVTQQIEYLRAVLDHMEAAQRHGLTRDEALDRAETLRERFRELSGSHFERLLDAAFDAAGH